MRKNKRSTCISYSPPLFNLGKHNRLLQVMSRELLPNYTQKVFTFLNEIHLLPQKCASYYNCDHSRCVQIQYAITVTLLSEFTLSLGWNVFEHQNFAEPRNVNLGWNNAMPQTGPTPLSFRCDSQAPPQQLVKEILDISGRISSLRTGALSWKALWLVAYLTRNYNLVLQRALPWSHSLI